MDVENILLLEIEKKLCIDLWYNSVIDHSLTYL